VVAVLLACSLAAPPARAPPERSPCRKPWIWPLKQNPALKIARARVSEDQQKEVTARADYFPQLS